LHPKIKKMTENKNFEIIVKTLAEFEPILEEELKKIGAKNIKKGNRAVSCTGDNEVLYRINYESRTALRVLKPITKVTANNPDKLYDEVKKIPWENFLNNEKTFAINSRVYSEIFEHSQFVTLKVKDAIVDRFREKTGERPSIDTKNPDIRINIFIQNDVCNISLDSSGDPLYKRGYKEKLGMAPLNEVLAAGMILLSDWNGKTDFVDFMCGAGTLVIEAGMIALNIPPQINRENFAFKNWKDFDKTLWQRIKEDAKAKIKKEDDVECHIFASDISLNAIMQTRQNVKNVFHEQIFTITKSAFDKLELPDTPKHIVINPPYGERLQKTDTDILYKKIGDELKTNFSGSEAWILGGNLQSVKKVGLRPSKKLTLYNGAIECKFLKYEMYSGSKKAKYNN